MNRRDMLWLLAVTPLAAAVVGAAAAVPPSPSDGLPDELHADTYLQWFKPGEDVEVTLNGLTLHDCVAANRVQGWADVILTRGPVHMRHVRLERLHGRVAFRRVSIPNPPEPQGGQQWHA